MDTENEKLILDGNAFYEIDLSCLRSKEKGNMQRQQQRGPDPKRKTGRNKGNVRSFE